MHTLYILLSLLCCLFLQNHMTYGYVSDSKFQPLLKITFYTTLQRINKTERTIPLFTSMPQPTQQIS